MGKEGGGVEETKEPRREEKIFILWGRCMRVCVLWVGFGYGSMEWESKEAPGLDYNDFCVGGAKARGRTRTLPISIHVWRGYYGRTKPNRSVTHDDYNSGASRDPRGACQEPSELRSYCESWVVTKVTHTYSNRGMKRMIGEMHSTNEQQ